MDIKEILLTIPHFAKVFSGDRNDDLTGIANLSQADGTNSGVSLSSSLNVLLTSLSTNGFSVSSFVPSSD